MEEKSNFVQGIVIEPSDLTNIQKITRTLTLKELLELKQATVNKIKSLIGSLNGLDIKDLTIKRVSNIINDIEKLQYNLIIFKQLNAIANVGSPEKNMLGINGIIYQAGDVKTLNSVLFNITTKLTVTNADKDLRKNLEAKMISNRTLMNNHYRTQTHYNETMKVKVEYLDITF